MIKNISNLSHVENLMLTLLTNAYSIKIPKGTSLYRGQSSPSIKRSSSFWSACRQSGLKHAKPWALTVKTKRTLNFYELQGLVDVIVSYDHINEFYNLKDGIEETCLLLHALARSSFFQKHFNIDGLIDTTASTSGLYQKIFIINNANTLFNLKKEMMP
jgi:hypothetical protein